MSQPVFTLYVPDGEPTREQVLERLARIPGQIRDMLSSRSPDDLLRARGEEWSAFQSLCHVRDAFLVYTMRFRWMVFDNDPLLPNYDENRWVSECRDTVDDVPAILDELDASRAGLVRVLSRLDEAGWQRTGRHEVIGRLVLEPYVRHQLAHEEAHLQQITEALARKS